MSTIPATTPVYVVGHNMPGYLSESDAFLTLDLNRARFVLADELETAADMHDAMADSIDDDDEDYASFTASAELVKSDRDGDIAASGGWCTIEPDGLAYWIAQSTMGEQFPDGDDGEEGYGALLDEWEDMHSVQR